MYTILICDDDKDIVSALDIYLTSEGYRTLKAYNGREAIQAVEQNEVHLILMDVMMPELDGIRATAKLREGSNVPIILLTAKSEDADKILGLHIGGLTKSEAENLIREKLKTYITEVPIVNVRMANYKISVMGEVTNPGSFVISNEKVNLFEALAMAGDMTIYGQRDNVKLIREDAQGHREIIPLNLNDASIILSPYYYLQQNDVIYVTPNKTKAKNAGISNSTTIWFSVVGTLVSLASLIVTISR